MIIERNSDQWFAALDAYVLERSQAPFAWGVQDCCTFAADWVKTATGIDPMADFRGITNPVAAVKALDGLGGMLAAWDSKHKPHLPGAMAQSGDLALVTLANNSKAMAICVGPWLVAPATVGLIWLGCDLAEATWRV